MATVTHRVTTPDTGATPNTSGSFTPVQNDLLVVFVVAAGVSGSTTGSTVTASANGITFTYAGARAAFGSNAHVVTCHIANQLVGASPAAMTVTWGNTADQSTGTVISVFSIAGMARTGTSAIKQMDSDDNRTSGVPNIVFPANVLTGNPTIGMVGLEGGATTNNAVPPSGWTEGGDSGFSTPNTGGESVFRNSGFTGTSVSWTSVVASITGTLMVEFDTSVPATDIDGNLGITASRTGVAERIAGISGNSSVSVSPQAAMAADKPVSGTLSLDVARSGAAGFMQDVSGDRGITVGRTGNASSPVNIDGALAISADRSGAASIAVVWQHVANYTGSLKTTSDLSVAVTAAVGDILLAVPVSDDVSGTDVLGTGSISDVAGNTWTRIATNQGQSAAGNVAGAIYYCKVTSALTAQNVTLSNSTAAKAMVISRFTGGSSVERGTYQTGAANAASWSVTHTSPESGDLVLGAIFMEDADGNTFTGDTDTTNGSWSTAVGAGTTGGGAASNVRVRTQHKIVTATGSQTWNGSLNTADHRFIMIALQVATIGVDISGDLQITASSAAASQVDKAISGDRAITVASSVTSAVDKPVSGDRAVSVSLVGAVDVVRPAVEISGNRSMTVAVSGEAVSGKDVAGNLAVSIAQASVTSVTKPVSGDRAVTVDRAGIQVLTKPISGALGVSADRVGVIGLVFGIAGNAGITVTRTGDITAGGVIDGSRSVAVGLVATASVVRSISGDRVVTAAFTSTTQASKPIGGTLGISAARVATLVGVFGASGSLVATWAGTGDVVAEPPYEPAKASVDSEARGAELASSTSGTSVFTGHTTTGREIG